MDLHRSPKSGQWQDVRPQNRNYFQKLANQTAGIITPGNLITMLGLGLSIVGLVALGQQHFWWAAALLTAGRLLDIADGYVANLTATKSPIGEALDALVDKVITLLVIIMLFIAAIAPVWLMIGLVAPQVLVVLIVAAKARHKIKVHPSLAGKLSMLFIWFSIVAIIVNGAAGQPVIEFISYGLVVASAVLGLVACNDYRKAA